MTRQSSAFEHDPRLTAFVLGELEEDEAAVIEKRLETDEQLRETVDAIRRTVVMLSEGLQAEPAPGLTEEQKQSIRQQAEAAAEPPVIFTMRRVWIGTGLAAAACVALALILPLLISPRTPVGSQGEYAREMPADEGKGEPVTTTGRGAGGEREGGRPGAIPEFADALAAGDSDIAETTMAELAETRDDLAVALATETEEGADRDRGGKATLGAPVADPSVSPPRGPGRPPLGEQGNVTAPAEAESPALGGGGAGKAGGERGDFRGRRTPPAAARAAPGSGLGAGSGPGTVSAESAPETELPRSRGAARTVAPHDFDAAAPGLRRSDQPAGGGREGYDYIIDNPFRRVSSDPALMPTFSVDVDATSYRNVRHFINNNQLPPPDAVRIEELLNYFSYDDPVPEPDSEVPFAVNVEIGPCPWKEQHRLARIGLKGREVLTEEMGGTVVAIAKDVKIQVGFNPAKVEAYRQIGYENCVLEAVDSTDDTKDAREIGSGHSVTALFEVVPAGVQIDLPEVEESKNAPDEDREAASGEDATEGDAIEFGDELMEVRLRYKQPDGDVSVENRFPVPAADPDLSDTSDDFRFAAGVACFGMVLRDSPYKGDSTYEMALELARSGVGDDAATYLEDFIHYTSIARPVLAAANLQALLDMEVSDVDLARLMIDQGITGGDLERFMTRATQMEETSELARELAGRIERGRAEMPVHDKTVLAVNHRRRFLELVERARAIPRNEQESDPLETSSLFSPLTSEQIEVMPLVEVREAIAQVAVARRRANPDAETSAILDRNFDLLLDRLRQGR
ncbi:MAG: von Willebrand factor type A domain-containing protein [Phycisphaerales bacterium]|nr:MAG: von Willebrand factor type A domain-containing protein [Phycisphaerales bacterium]